MGRREWIVWQKGILGFVNFTDTQYGHDSYVWHCRVSYHKGGGYS